MFTIVRNKYLSQVLLSLFLLGLLSCCRDDDPCATCPPPHTPTIVLTIDDVGVTDAWLKLESVDSSALGSVTLMRDTIQVLSANIFSRDTIILDEGLLPKKHYTYTVYRMDGETRIDSSAPLQIILNDSSAGEWHWTLDTLGDGNASLFNDVCIVNDTLAYAVGRIEILDSSNNFVIHNLAIWNGNDWMIKKILFPIYNFDCTVAYYTAANLSSVFLLPSGKLLITSGSSAALMNDTTIIHYPCTQGTRSGAIMKTWGLSENDFYAVGGNGTLIRYLNGEWKKLESGTTLDIQDIWGAKNPETGEMEILACAAEKFTLEGKQILKIRGDSVSLVTYDELPYQLGGIWFIPNRKYYVVGSAIYSKKDPRESARWARDAGHSVVQYYMNAIGGTDLNNVMIVGDFGDVISFNGFRWKSQFSKTYIGNGGYYSVAMKGNLAIVVGRVDYKAIIAVGRRY